jgi:hypothetical protein
MKKLLTLTIFSFALLFGVSCKTFTNQEQDIKPQANTTDPGCDAATDFKNTLESILTSDIEAEEDAQFTKIKDSSKKTATITHVFTSISANCAVNSKLVIQERDQENTKLKTYYLTIYLSYGNKKDGSKETITIKSNWPSVILNKAESIITTEKK